MPNQTTAITLASLVAILMIIFLLVNPTPAVEFLQKTIELVDEIIYKLLEKNLE